MEGKNALDNEMIVEERRGICEPTLEEVKEVIKRSINLNVIIDMELIKYEWKRTQALVRKAV